MTEQEMVDLVNVEFLPPDHKYTVLIFDNTAPKLVTYVSHLRTFGDFLLKLADMAQEDGHPMRVVVMDGFLVEVLSQHHDYKERRPLPPGAMQVGAWRGYQVFLDSRFGLGRGCLLDEHREVCALIRMVNV